MFTRHFEAPPVFVLHWGNSFVLSAFLSKWCIILLPVSCEVMPSFSASVTMSAVMHGFSNHLKQIKHDSQYSQPSSVHR